MPIPKVVEIFVAVVLEVVISERRMFRAREAILLTAGSQLQLNTATVNRSVTLLGLWRQHRLFTNLKVNF